MIKLLFIGDIVGYIGREATKKILPKLIKKYKPSLVVANAENLAHGKGVTEGTLKEMQDTGINFFTSGNHIFSRKNFADILNNKNFNLLRPANYPEQMDGIGEKVINISQKKVLLVNLIGRVFLKENFDCPFKKFDKIYKKYYDKVDIIMVDFHAEATSEKKAFALYADGRANIIIGTHTHIQTSDEQILPNNSAYITDVGAVAAKNSVLGVDSDVIIKSFLDQVNYAHEMPRSGECEFSAVIVGVDKKTNEAKNITRIQEIVTIK